jgi:glycerophosphoryl diester phosphodiesterase
VIAHRGASGAAPENTLVAFKLALKLGAGAVECDVQMTRDRVPVVLHDPRVDRTTDGRGSVHDLALEEVRRLDAGRWFASEFAGERIPTLEEVVSLCAGRSRVFVELKPHAGQALVDAVLPVLSSIDACDVAVISFDAAMLERVVARRPDLPLGLLVNARRVAVYGAPSAAALARRSGASFLAPQHTCLSERLISAVRAAGLGLSVWTVDDPERLRQLAAQDVDALTTNRPDIAIRVVDTLTQRRLAPAPDTPPGAC